MSLPEPTNAWMDERLEAYLDGDLPPDEEAAFERRLRTDDDWQNELQAARRLRDELRALPTPECPPEVTRAALQRARPSRSDRGPMEHPSRPPNRRFSHRAWGLAAAALLLALAAVVATQTTRSPSSSENISETEIEHATAEVKWTLAYLANVGRQTGETVQHDVLRDHVARPMRRAFHPLTDETSETREE